MPHTDVHLGSIESDEKVSKPLPAPKHRHKPKTEKGSSIEKKVAKALQKRKMADGTEELLYRTLLDPNYYEKNVRPTAHHLQPTNITFGFLLNQIVEMDERNQILTTRCWLNVNWLDKRISWNSSEWEGIKNLYIPHKKLWTPDIILVNNAVREYYESILSTDVMATSEGNVTWLFSALFKSSCQMRVRYYPFDTQECYLRFSSWSHDASEIDLGLTTNQGDLSSYLNSTEFDLVELSAIREVKHFPSDNTSLWPTISIMIRMERRPLFYVFNHIIPCILISAMAVFGFAMPPETGEKINLSITTMLSMGVYLQSITESIPPTSEAVPLIGQYYVASLFIVCLATAINVMSLNVHRTGVISQGRHVPYWMERFVLGYLATALRMQIHEPDSITLLKSSQAKASIIRRSSLLRDLKRLRNADSLRGSKDESQLCECLIATSIQTITAPNGRKAASINHHHNHPNNLDPSRLTELELLERPTSTPGESAFLQRVVTDQVIPRMSIRPQAVGEFEDRFKRILKRVYRTLQQREIRDEILDERQRIMWQWQCLAEVVDRFFLFVFSCATLGTILCFLVLPVTLRDLFNYSLF
uniref:Ligand-gated ion channel 4 n=1 Tax=Panagrellus redivivus TaxID=6233 RepID=A0A7E4ZU89_PANRE